MGLVSGVVGFGIGVPVGLVVGYFIFIYFRRYVVKDPLIVKPLREFDITTGTLYSLFSEIPLWVKNPDYDRVDWMNKFIFHMWPYLDKGICNTLQSTAKPLFSDYIGKYMIQSIEFDHLTLGSLPPTITGVKVFETQEKQSIIELGVRWAGNPNIMVAVKWLTCKLTFQLTDLQVFMTPRITLKPLVPTFPCFANIHVSLIDKPHIDFGLKLLGGDIMAIPGLYRFIQETIKQQVAILYHWPKVLEVPILDGSCGGANKPVGILHVKVVRALNLMKMDLLGKSDPYVKLSLSGERLPSKKTTIKMCNLNPEWNEEFKLVVKDPQTQVLQLHLFDWEKVKVHDKLGMQVVPLSLLTPNEMKVFTLDVVKNLNTNDPQNKRNRGKLIVELRFDPFKEEFDRFSGSVSGSRNIDSIKKDSQSSTSDGGVLSVAVERAEDVEGKHHTNPYVVVLFRGEERRTKRIRKTRDPRWNSEFQFMLDEEPIDQKIHIEVMSRRKFSLFPKESLGHVDINLTDVVNNGRINEKYNLVNSRNGVIHIELRWSTV